MKVVDILPVPMTSHVQRDSTKSSLKIPAIFEPLLLPSGKHMSLKGLAGLIFEIINEDDVAQRYFTFEKRGTGLDG
jgi:hypothetical protein